MPIAAHHFDNLSLIQPQDILQTVHEIKSQYNKLRSKRHRIIFIMSYTSSDLMDKINFIHTSQPTTWLSNVPSGRPPTYKRHCFAFHYGVLMLRANCSFLHSANINAHKTCYKSISSLLFMPFCNCRYHQNKVRIIAQGYFSRFWCCQNSLN